ncbi:MAG: ABC transporter ATP-binding protein/permease [Acidobacteriia bacterium]|nr:ABC transporter ATP-binding protein/permease [Terriglobia bacterium]
MLSLLRPERKHYARGLLSLLVVNLADVAGPLFIALAVDIVASAWGAPGPGAVRSGGARPGAPPLLRLLRLDPSHVTLAGAIAGYLALQIIANVCRYPMLVEVAVASHRVGQTLRNRLVDHLLRLARPFYDRAKTGDLMSLATADVAAIRMFYGPGTLLLVDTAMLMVFVLGVMFGLSVPLTLAALVPLPLIALFTNKISHAEFERFGAVQADLAKLTERARESYAGIRIVQGYAREQHVKARFAEHSRRHFGFNLSLARVQSLFDPSLDLLLGLSTVLVLVFGGAEIARGRMTVGTFVAFLFLVGNLSGPMIGFGWAWSLFQRGRASTQRLEALFAEPAEIRDAPGATEAKGPGELVVRGLTFSFAAGAKPALDGIDLTLAPGRTLGIVGPVGSGKSTLVSLLARLYDPPPGAVLLDGVDVRDLTLDSLRRAVVVAPQDTFLFGDTVEGNVSLASAGERPDLWRLARLSAIDEEIAALPEAFETLLGERGYSLSGGQRQRLAIARAIAADPRILVLDDCLSAVDARTEEAILGNLGEVFRGRSAIVVSHRVRAVAPADEIIVLDGGRIAARGTHGELMARDGYYASIAREQMREERDADADGGGSA